MELWQVSDLHDVRFVEESQSHIVALRGTLGMCQPPRSFTSCIEYSQLVREQCLMHVRSQEPPSEITVFSNVFVFKRETGRR